MIRESFACQRIQHVYRLHLQRLYGSSMVLTRLAERRLHYRAASRINGYARGRLSRRRAKTERSLRLIKQAHPVLIQLALQESSTRKKLFWYARKEELRMVHSKLTQQNSF